MSDRANASTPRGSDVPGHGPTFGAMLQEFNVAARLLNLDPGVWQILTHPKRQIIVSCPVQMDNGEIEVFTGFRVQYNITLGPEKDVPAPDVNTNDQIMAWVMDTYSMHVGHTTTSVVTGKPVELGGSLGRREATGRGVMIATRQAAKHVGIDLKGATVAVQGFGNVGSISAELLAEQGAKIVAVTDWQGGIHNPAGLDVAKLLAHVQQTKTVEGFPGG